VSEPDEQRPLRATWPWHYSRELMRALRCPAIRFVQGDQDEVNGTGTDTLATSARATSPAAVEI